MQPQFEAVQKWRKSTFFMETEQSVSSTEGQDTLVLVLTL